MPKLGKLWRNVEPEWLRGDDSFARADRAAQVLRSEHLDIIQGKACYQLVEEVEVRVVARRRTVCLKDTGPKGERQVWKERRTEQNRRVIHLHADIRCGPRKHVFVFLIIADEHALQRPGVLSPVCKSCNIRKKFLHITVCRKRIAVHFKAQPGEGW